MATFIVGAVVLAVVGLIIRSMVKDKKNGKSLQCGCDCKHCGCRKPEQKPVFYHAASGAGNPGGCGS